MSSMLTIGASGMNAARTALDVSAHNIANLGTPGFRRQQVQPLPLEGGGVGTTVTQAPVPGDAPEADMVGLLQARNAFLMNLAVFKTGDRMLGTLLDSKG